MTSYIAYTFTSSAASSAAFILRHAHPTPRGGPLHLLYRRDCPQPKCQKNPSSRTRNNERVACVIGSYCAAWLACCVRPERGVRGRYTKHIPCSQTLAISPIRQRPNRCRIMMYVFAIVLFVRAVEGTLRLGCACAACLSSSRSQATRAYARAMHRSHLVQLA